MLVKIGLCVGSNNKDRARSTRKVSPKEYNHRSTTVDLTYRLKTTENVLVRFIV